MVRFKVYTGEPDHRNLTLAIGEVPYKMLQNAGFIQARLCKIQGLFKDFSKTFLLFSRTENLRKILIYTLKFYF